MYMYIYIYTCVHIYIYICIYCAQQSSYRTLKHPGALVDSSLSSLRRTPAKPLCIVPNLSDEPRSVGILVDCESKYLNSIYTRMDSYKACRAQVTCYLSR